MIILFKRTCLSDKSITINTLNIELLEPLELLNSRILELYKIEVVSYLDNIGEAI